MLQRRSVRVQPFMRYYPREIRFRISVPLFFSDTVSQKLPQAQKRCTPATDELTAIALTTQLSVERAGIQGRGSEPGRSVFCSFFFFFSTLCLAKLCQRRKVKFKTNTMQLLKVRMLTSSLLMTKAKNVTLSVSTF